MEYGVSIELGLPAGSANLDPLQAEGAASLLTRVLDRVDSAQASDGSEVLVERFWVGAYPEGALVFMTIDADMLEIAEVAARDIMVQVLQQTEILADWPVLTCEVGLDPRLVEAGLDVPDDAELPPADPAERARWHARRQRGEEHPEQGVDWRAWAIRHVPLLRAFNADVFTAAGVEESDAGLAAGALTLAAGLIIDELFQDLRTLGGLDGPAVADSDGVYFVLEDLPERFAHHYNMRFVHRFLAATTMITGRLAQDEWASPASMAEALALHLVVERARQFLSEHELLGHEVIGTIYHGFDDAAFDDLDHRSLYGVDMDGFENDDEVESWFQQAALSGAHVHPYSVELAPELPQ